MKRILLILFLAALTHGMAQESGKSTANTMSERQVQLNILRDSVDMISQHMVDLAREQQRILQAIPDGNHPVIMNLEGAYLNLLTSREQLQIKIARLQDTQDK